MLVKNNYDFVFIAEKNNDDTRIIKKSLKNAKSQKPYTKLRTKKHLCRLLKNIGVLSENERKKE